MEDPSDFTEWKAARLAALTAADGWLNLTDRLDIPPGAVRVGRAEGNDLVLSAGPDHLGVLQLTDGGASFTTPDGQTRAFVASEGFPQLLVPPLLLELHTVDGIPALRVRDTSQRASIALRYFPYDPAWRITARIEALPDPQSLTIGQKGGADTSIRLTHRARFTHDGREITLLPTHWKGGKPMFVIRDATSGKETYAASRFLIGEVSGDQVVLDFNRAHSPPCAFTDFAICPLPPPENRLPFAVKAGELAP